MMNDNRKHQRLEIFFVVEIKPQQEGSFYLMGITKNMSVEGFSFESENFDLKKGEILEFDLKHPKSEFSFSVQGEIIWEKDTSFERLTGVKFLNVNEDIRGKIAEIISEDSLSMISDTNALTTKDCESGFRHLSVSEGTSCNSDEVVSNAGIQGGEFTGMEASHAAANTVNARDHATEETEADEIIYSDSAAHRPSSLPVNKEFVRKVSRSNPARTMTENNSAAHNGSEKKHIYLIGAVTGIVIIAALMISSGKHKENINNSVPGLSSSEPVGNEIEKMMMPAAEDTITVLPIPADTKQKESSLSARSASPEHKDSAYKTEALPKHDEPDKSKRIPAADKVDLAPEATALQKLPPQEADGNRPGPTLSNRMTAISKPSIAEMVSILEKDNKAFELLGGSLAANPEQTPAKDDISMQAIKNEAPHDFASPAKEPRKDMVVNMKNLPLQKPSEVPPGSDSLMIGEDRKIEAEAVSGKKASLLVKKPPVNDNVLDSKRGISDKKILLSVSNKASSEKRSLVYEELFNNNSGKWDIFNTKDASARITGGEYFIENKRTQGSHLILSSHDFSDSGDFIIESSVRAIAVSVRSFYGIVFSGSDALNNYVFQITKNGQYSIKKFQKGVAKEFKSGNTKLVSSGSMSYDSLKVKKTGNVLSFYINDSYVDRVSDISLSGDKIGFIIDSRSNIAVDGLRLQKLK